MKPKEVFYYIPFVCHGAKWGFESFETSKALPLPYTYLLLSQGWGERHSALYSELKKCSHGNSFMELLYCGPDFDYRGFVYVCLWALKSTGFFFLPKIYVAIKLFLNSKFLNMYCEGPLVGEMGTGRNPTFGYHYHQILKYGQSLAINEEIFYKILPIFELPIDCLILLPNSAQACQWHKYNRTLCFKRARVGTILRS